LTNEEKYGIVYVENKVLQSGVGKICLL
jgi:hypothetical protein